MQDSYYNVRGPEFVISRVEQREHGRPARAKFMRSKPLPARRPGHPPPESASLGLIRQAIASQPMALVLISEGPLLDVEVEVVEPAAAAPTPDTLATSACTGIVRVPSGEGGSEASEAELGDDLYKTSSNSPRRTKMLRFTCLANGCQAVNVKPISPEAFQKGTVFAQCGRCSNWHLIRDHLNLWDQSKRPVYRPHMHADDARGAAGPQAAVEAVALEDLPEGLRPAPEDVEFYNGGGGRVGGWEHKKQK